MPKLTYEVSRIESVSKSKNGYSVTSDNGWLLFVPIEPRRKGDPIIPAPKRGGTIETYGEIGRPIRGICINGRTIFFKVTIPRSHVRIDNLG
jgi:hypothetical protein